MRLVGHVNRHTGYDRAGSLDCDGNHPGRVVLLADETTGLSSPIPVSVRELDRDFGDDSLHGQALAQPDRGAGPAPRSRRVALAHLGRGAADLAGPFLV